MDSLLRYFDMLCLIPKAPNSISTPEILEKLQNMRYEVDLRIVQRDLVKLSASPLFPIANTENMKPLHWWIRSSAQELKCLKRWHYAKCLRWKRKH